MRDVARLAEVSRATVSNVINKPHTVSPLTRKRVEAALHDSGYEYTEQGTRFRPNSIDPSPADGVSGIRSTPAGALTKPTEDRPQGGFVPGQRVRFHDGDKVISGVIDVMAPDGTALWVWCDAGLGRKLLWLPDGHLARVE
jgi:hypothetical protein